MRKIPLILVADNVRSMQNIGAFFRTSDAFLVEEIILGGISGSPPNPAISKTALGAEDSVAWRHVDNTLQAVEELKKDGWSIYVLEQTFGSIPLQDISSLPLGKSVLVVGNEVDGVDQRIVDIADAAIEIEMNGVKHSLNVSVSAGIALWEFYKKMKQGIIPAE